jgi:hypothetical protein
MKRLSGTIMWSGPPADFIIEDGQIRKITEGAVRSRITCKGNTGTITVWIDDDRKKTKTRFQILKDKK